MVVQTDHRNWEPHHGELLRREPESPKAGFEFQVCFAESHREPGLLAKTMTLAHFRARMASQDSVRVEFVGSWVPAERAAWVPIPSQQSHLPDLCRMLRCLQLDSALQDLDCWGSDCSSQD